MTNSWKSKRRNAIKGFLTAWDKYDGKDPEKVNAALDALAVAHIATSLESETVSVTNWSRKEDSAMEHLAQAYLRYDEADEDPKAEERLNIALDTLTLAHVASTFEWASGPLKW